MALIAHYKFDGNYNDSLGAYNATNYGASVIDAGIVGSNCLAVSGTQYVQVPSVTGWGAMTQATVSCWVSAAQAGYQQILEANSANNSFNIHYSWGGSGANIYWDFGNISANGRVTIPHTTDSGWHHWVFTAGPKGMFIYRDGIMLVKSNYSSSYNATGLTMRIGNTGTTYPLNGKIDDLRIYNHQLSAKDVSTLYNNLPPTIKQSKEIDKQLKIHYSFDFLEEYTDNILKTVAGLNCSATASGAGYPFYSFGAPLDSWFKANIGKTCTMSFEGCHNGGTGYPVMYFFHGDWSWAQTVSITTLEWTRSSLTFTIPDSTGKTVYGPYFYHMSSGATGVSYCRNMQLELKDHVTPFVNGTRASVVPDNSGNDNNGVMNSICPTLNTSNKLGVGKIVFGDSYFTALPSALTLANYTVSFWKSPQSGTMPLASSNGSIYAYGDTSWRYVHGGVAGEYYYPTTTTLTTPYMLTVTYNGSQVSVYRNAVLQGTAAAGSGTAVFQNLLFGKFHIDGYKYTLDMDDFRLYGTALSQTDITELYQTRISLDSQSSVIAKTFLENDSIAYTASRIDYSTWVNGTSGSQTGFPQNGDGNYIIIKKNPIGIDDIVWATLDHRDGEADGGWNENVFSIDSSKKYRYSVWIRRENTQTGTTYLGCLANSVDTLGTSTAHTNPYFFHDTMPNVGEWYLLIAYIWPSSYTLTVSDPTTAIYNTAGKVVKAMGGNSGYGGDFKWHAGATQGGHRSYLYYSSDPNSYQYFYRPRVDLIDGNEPTIGDLLACRENPVLYNKPTSVLRLNSSGVYEAEEFSEVGPTRGLVAWYDFEGATATKVPDIVGVNHGTGGALPTFGNMGLKKTIIFHGTGQYVACGSFFTYQYFTISFWVNPSATQVAYADIFENNHTADQSFVLQQNNTTTNQYSFGCMKAGGNVANSGLFNLTANSWTHIVISIDASNLYTYINNSLFSTIARSGNIVYINQIFRLGNWTAGTRSFSGSLADFRIYNRVLNTKDIATLYNLKPANVYIENNKTINAAQLVES